MRSDDVVGVRIRWTIDTLGSVMWERKERLLHQAMQCSLRTACGTDAWTAGDLLVDNAPRGDPE